jgi:F-type H+-transporting ATPase subunit delta
MIDNKRARREAKQLFRMCLVDSSLDEDRVRQVVQQVSATGRRNSRAILTHLLRLVRLDHDQHTARIESATPLSAELQAATRASLTRLYGPGLATVFSDRPSLIGGMRIQIGSDVYDGTVQAGLAALEKCF